jgi:hypothetical protein
MAPDNKDNKDIKDSKDTTDKKDKPDRADKNERPAKAPTADEFARQYADLSTRVAGVRRGL